MTDYEIKILCEIRDKYCHWGEVAVMDKAINELLNINQMIVQEKIKKNEVCPN